MVHFAGYRFGYTGYMRFGAKFSKRMLTVVIVEGNLDLFQLRNICHQTHYFECYVTMQCLKIKRGIVLFVLANVCYVCKTS